MKPPLEGRLIRLRAREPEDEPVMFRWVHDPEVTEFLSMRYPLSHAQELDFVSRTSAPSYTNPEFAIETLAEGRVIGTVGLRPSLPENRCAELGIMVGEKEFWNGGYGTDTMRTMCRFGFQMMNLHRIELDVLAGNDRAKHVYEKVGFKVEGVRREAIFKYGRYIDVYQMGVLPEEFIDDPGREVAP